MVMKEVLTDLEDMNLLARLFPHYANAHQDQHSQPNGDTDPTIPTSEDGEGSRNSQTENHENEQSHLSSSSSSSSSSQQELEIDSSILDKVLPFSSSLSFRNHHITFKYASYPQFPIPDSELPFTSSRSPPLPNS